jgi:hypothetical protein
MDGVGDRLVRPTTLRVTEPNYVSADNVRNLDLGSVGVAHLQMI